MRIAVNCRSILLSQRTGIGRYTYHLLDTLGEIDPTNEYILHAPKGLFDFKRRLPDFSSHKNFKRYPDYFNRGVVSRYDIYHFPCPDAIGTYKAKLIVTVHDLIYKTHPQSHTPQTIELTEKYMQAITAKADRIICISENTRRDLHAFYDIAPERTCVVYNGVDHRIFYPFSHEQKLYAQKPLRALGVIKPYVLYVGTIEPRKNLAGLLESFALLKSKNIFQGQLVVVGMKGWMVEKIEELIQKLGLKQEVIFTGFISDTQLCQLYNMAELFVFPSFYEGFGFPILEAFSCGAAVICAQTSSCGEIAGEAALKIDPMDIQAMAQAMEKVLRDENLKSSLCKAAIKRSQGFSLVNMATQTLAIYRHINI